jgi:hypothetical protein
MCLASPVDGTTTHEEIDEASTTGAMPSIPKRIIAAQQCYNGHAIQDDIDQLGGKICGQGSSLGDNTGFINGARGVAHRALSGRASSRFTRMSSTAREIHFRQLMLRVHM